MLPWIQANLCTLTLIDIHSLTLGSWQFLMAPLINHYELTSMCASYIRWGRVIGFVHSDVAPAQQPPSGPRPALERSRLHYIPHPVPRHSHREAKNQGGDGDGPRGCKVLWPTSNPPPQACHTSPCQLCKRHLNVTRVLHYTFICNRGISYFCSPVSQELHSYLTISCFTRWFTPNSIVSAYAGSSVPYM